MYERMMRICCAAIAALTLGTAAQAQTQAPVLAAAHTIAGGDASRVDPAERSFTIATAGTYTLTLTDLANPAPFALLTMVVTSGASVVATGSVPASGAPAAVQFSATSNTTYVVHVVGGLASGQTWGNLGVKLTDVSGHDTSVSFSDPDNSSAPATVGGFNAVLSLPPGKLPANAGVLDQMITITAAGTYTIDIVDLAYPAALNTLTANLTDPSAQEVPGFPIPAVGASQSVSFNAVPGSYHLVVAAVQASGASGGLYSVHIHSATADVFSTAVPLGQVLPLVDPNQPDPSQARNIQLAAGPANLTFKDLQFPAPLSQGTAVAVHAGAIVASTAAGSPAAFTAVADTYQLFVLAIPASSGGGGTPAGTGAFGVTVAPQGGAPEFSTVQVAGSGATGGAYAYAFPAEIGAGGSYTLTLADFNFPQPFAAMAAVAVQNGVTLGTALTAAGSANISVVPGRVYVLAAVTPGSGGRGVFGVDLLPSAGGAAALAATQGVGGAFGTTTVNITTAGSYNVTLADLVFPANFHDLSAVVTQGATRLGSIYGGGTFSFSATPGTYIINVLGTPAPLLATSQQSDGTYSVSVISTPAAPTVTLTASATQVASGGTVTLTWSSQNATSCSATGGWSGSLATSGTQASSALSAATTFTLACTGPGGTTTQSATVSIAPAAPKGGGGSLDVILLLLLSGALVARVRGQQPWRVGGSLL